MLVSVGFRGGARGTPFETRRSTSGGVDVKRVIEQDGWAMLLAIGDEVEGSIYDAVGIAQTFECLRFPLTTMQDVRSSPRANNVSLGTVINAELRADDTELWVQFDHKVAAHRRRRAVLGRSARDKPGSVSICTPEVRPFPGDREQRK